MRPATGRWEHLQRDEVVYYAHSFGNEKQPSSKWQLLSDHLMGVARLAEQFAREARPGDEDFAAAARAAGLLHDVGKYRDEFQEMIRGIRPKGESTRHKQFGAAQALKQKRHDVAFPIMGHHGGLPNLQNLKEESKCVEKLVARIVAIATSELSDIQKPLPPMASFSNDLPVRLLFSSLVDADWIDTGDHEAKSRGQALWEPPPHVHWDAMVGHVRDYVTRRSAACKDRQIAVLRAEVLFAAERAASLPPGLFSMTVPTGGGKTLSSLMFALQHAQQHHLERIIYIAPYLSIIDQNARVFRDALGPACEDLILEHHSLSEPRSRLDRGSAEPRGGLKPPARPTWGCTPIFLAAPSREAD